MSIKSKGNPSALLASRQHAECFILCTTKARPCCNCFKELTHECLVKAYPFQSITHPSTSSSCIRWIWMISYASTSISSLILAELTWICHLVYNRFLTLYSAILWCSTPDVFPVLYGKYSTDFCFDPPMQGSLKYFNISLSYINKYIIL